MILGVFVAVNSGLVTFTNAVVFFSTLSISGYLSAYREPNTALLLIVPTALLSALIAGTWSNVLHITYIYYCVVLAPCVVLLGTLAHTSTIFFWITVSVIFSSSLFLAWV
jgi:hypothetical protein